MQLLKLLENQAQRQVVGTLTLGKRKCFREVFFEAETVYLVGQQFSGKVPLDRLGQLGIPGGRVSVEKFETTLRAADLTKRLVPQVLLDSGLITDDELQPLVEEQVREEILALLFRCPGSFHFQEGRVPEYLLKSEELTARTPVPLASVLEELRKRTALEAQWSALIPSTEEIFVTTEKGMSIRQSGEADYAYQIFLGLIDGLRSLGTIIADGYLLEFTVMRLAARALEDGVIKKTIHPELRGISTQNLSTAEIEACLPHFKNAVKYGVDELSARERLAVVFEKLARIDDAVIQYNYMGDALYRMHKQAKAIKAYQRALLLKPGELLLTDKITKIYREAADEEIANHNTPQAIQFLEGALRMRPADQEVFAKLMDLLIQDKKLTELSNLADWMISCSRKAQTIDVGENATKMIVARLPRNAAFRKKLINLYLDFNRASEARGELEELARQYAEKGQTAKAQEIVEKIRRIGGAGQDVRSLTRTLDQAKAMAVKPRNRSKVPVWVFLGLLAFLAVYQGAAWMAWTRIVPRAAHAAPRNASSGGGVLLTADAEERECRDTAERCRNFLNQFPFTLLGGKARNLLATSKARAAELEGERRTLAHSMVESARKAIQEGDKEDAEHRLAELVNQLPPGDEFHVAARELMGRATAIRRSAAELLAEAKSLEAEAQAASDTGRPSAEAWRKSFRTYCEIATRFPSSPLARDLRLPAWVESLPRGAVVRDVTEGGEGKEIGNTPLVIHLTHGEPRDLVLAAKGYEKLAIRLSETTGEEANYRLLRQARHQIPLAGKTGLRISVHEHQIFCGSGDGSIQAFDVEGDEVAGPTWSWGVSGTTVQGIVGRPIVAPEGIYTLWNDGRMLRVARGEKGPQEAVKAPPPEAAILGGLGTTPLLAMGKAKLVVVGTRKAQVEFLDRRRLESRWAVDTAGVPTCIVETSGGTILAGSNEGRLQEIDPVRREIVWSGDAGKDAVDDILDYRGSIVAVTRARKLVSFRLPDRHPVEGPALPPGTLFGLFREEGRICSLGTDGVLRIHAAETSKEISRVELRISPTRLWVLPETICIAQEDSSSILIVDRQNQEILWNARVDGKICDVAGTEAWLAVAVDESPRPPKLYVYPLH